LFDHKSCSFDIIAVEVFAAVFPDIGSVIIQPDGEINRRDVFNAAGAFMRICFPESEVLYRLIRNIIRAANFANDELRFGDKAR